MANPQRENGHIDVAHEIVEKFCKYRLSGEEWQVLWVILRKTYGWQKKKDKIALSQFKEMTKLPRSKACYLLSKLVTRGVIKKDNTIPTTYSFVKDYDKWKVLPKKVTSSKVLPKKVMSVTQKGNTSVIKNDNQVLPILGQTNTTLTKETITNNTITKERFIYLEDLNFTSIFESYLKNRKKKATDHAKELILKDLHKVDKVMAIAMLEQSIKNGWIGIFPIKKENEYGRFKGDVKQDNREDKYAGVGKTVKEVQ